MTRLHASLFFAFLVLASNSAYGQDFPSGTVLWFHPNQELRITGLPLLSASSTDSSAVLAAALETILRDKTVCCGKNSALGDAVLSDPSSLKELSAKLQGKHFLSEGGPIVVNAEVVQMGGDNSGLIITALQDQNPLLMEWNSNLYVLYGAVFNETRYSNGTSQYTILRLRLLDPRFSDKRREAEFDRGVDDWGRVKGLMTLSVARQ